MVCFGQDLAGTVWGLMVASWGSEKSSLGHNLLFWCSFWSFGSTLKNPYFSHFLSLLAAARRVPGASGVPELATFLAFWVNFLARARPDDVSAPAGLQAVLQK